MNTSTAIEDFQNVQAMFSGIAMLHLLDYLYEIPVKIRDGANYDIIIIGGGTAGCVIASRLAEVRQLKVLLVEAGGNPPFESTFPAYFAILKNTTYDWNLTSTQDDLWQYHRDGVASITQGKMLGGSSSLNYMVFQPGNSMDYDKWSRITKDPSWKFNKVLPLLKKSEKITDKLILNSPLDKALHGTKGPLELRKYYYKEEQNYFSAYEEIGVKNVLDINERNPLGVTNILFANGKGGRQSTAYSFLRQKKNCPNLDVLTNALVTKILIDSNNIAYGVQIRINEKVITVTANKEVVLCAGAIKSPQLLMVSGIGPRQYLEDKEIEVKVNLPVGDNLQDHPIVILPFRMGKRKPTTKPLNPYEFGIPALDAYIAMNKSQKYSDYEILSLVVDNPTTFLQICGVILSFTNDICDRIIKGLGDKQIYVAFDILSYSNSKGKIRLNSRNMEDQPIIDLNYYSDKQDLIMHAKSVINFKNILNTKYFRSVNAKFIDVEPAVCIKLDKESEEYWQCYCSAMVSTGHYFAGTCAMGSVVDAKLFVKGIKKLRVADASIMPTIVGAPTEAAVIIIAQKAADMIIKTLNK